MNPERQQFLDLGRRRVRLRADETAWLLGLSGSDLSILLRRNLLKPLGSPTANGFRCLDSTEVDVLRADAKWWAKARDAVRLCWRAKKRAHSARRGPHPLPLQRETNGTVPRRLATSLRDRALAIVSQPQPAADAFVPGSPDCPIRDLAGPVSRRGTANALPSPENVAFHAPDSLHPYGPHFSANHAT